MNDGPPLQNDGQKWECHNNQLPSIEGLGARAAKGPQGNCQFKVLMGWRKKGEQQRPGRKPPKDEEAIYLFLLVITCSA
jgi:hypothetical protein